MGKIRLARHDFTWSSNLAYAVGLITTDGNLSKDGRHINFISSDIGLIKTFKKCLKKKNKISINPPSGLSKKTAFRVQIGDVVFYDWLIKIGLTPNKSLTIGPIALENKFFPDFVRGHLDGDGNVRNYIDKYNTKIDSKYIYERFFIFLRSASKKHIYWLRGKIQELSGISGSIQKTLSKSQIGKSPMFVIKYSTNEAKVLANWIYYDNAVPKLLRKYYIAKKFLTLKN